MRIHRLVRTGLVLGVGLLGGASTARAQEVGCCRAACQQVGGDGKIMGFVRAMPLTSADCSTQFAGCDVSWEAGPCPDLPGGGGRTGEMNGRDGPGKPSAPGAGGR
jgi:hypothetical protein